MSNDKDLRIYKRADCAVFRKTAEAFGGLSNMAPGYPVRINGVRVLTVEALYQACRFPHLPDVQRKIIAQTSPMTAKMVGKPYRDDSRPDWDRVRVKIMRWVLRLKLAMHWTQFSALLLSTGDRPIVEDSRKDDFWGAIPTDAATLVGMNVLGRLLMELREEIKQGAELRLVAPPAIPDLLLFDEVMGVVDFRDNKSKPYSVQVETIHHAVHDFSTSLFPDTPVDLPAQRSIGNLLQPIAERRSSMIAGLNPYSEYKSSGLPWANSIPLHWSLIPNRAVLKKRKILVGTNHVNHQLLSLTKGGVIVRDISTGKGKFSADMGTSQEVRKGDFVFCLFDVPETPRTVGLSAHDGMITSAYTVFEARKLQSESIRYLERFYLAMDDQKLLSPLYSGLRHTIPPSRFLGIKSPHPPPDEQAAIVRFLDHANRKIDGFVRAKRKLIALLNEQKRAIIHSAVTRGINPDVQFRPSGIPSLGDIPMHWAQHALWTLSQIREERNPKGLQLLSVFLDRGVIRYDEGGGQVHAPSLDLSNYQVVHPGDFVLNNQQAWRGSVGVSQHHGIISPAYIVLRLSAKLDSIYANYLMRCHAMVGQFVTASKGVGDIQRGVFIPFLRYVQVPFPPFNEQKKITEYLASETHSLDAAVARTKREIALMQEYRTRLTSDIVTGKLDVREAAAKLPELPEDVAPEHIADDVLEEIEAEES